MKIEAKENHIWIYADTPEEQRLLDTFESYGTRVWGKSTDGIAISSPHEAGLKQLHISREQQAILANALGVVETNLFNNALIVAAMGNINQINVIKIATAIGDLKEQLFITPDPIPSQLTAPSARMVAKTNLDAKL